MRFSKVCLFSISLLASLAIISCDDSNSNNNENNINNINNIVCGNDIIEGNETCDGSDLGSITCVDLGYDGGSLGCLSNCSDYDESGCTSSNNNNNNQVCGNEIIEGNETCDGTNLNNNDCTTIGAGFTGGTLECLPDCSGWDTTSCTQSIEPACGNDIIEEGEACEANDLAGVTCESLGFLGGELACGPTCQFDAGNCQSPYCGDGEIGQLEVCESGDLNGNDCTTIGMNFVGGTLACNENCQWDYSQCETCGNGTLDVGETCDGSLLDANNCTTIDAGFISGTLACNSTCDGWNISECIPPVCGDDIITVDIGEICDNENLNGNDCTTIGEGFINGELACGVNCETWDTSNCNLPVCGDGIITVDATEVCDGTNLGGNDCTTIGEGFVTGELACGVNCETWDTSNCNLPFCGDGIITVDATEVCDGTNLGGNDCTTIDMGFIDGDLACKNNCTWDVSGCIAPVCGDGVITSPEVCDGTNLDGYDCSDLGFGGGTLACNPTECTWDFNSCTDGCGNNTLEGSELCDGDDLGPESCSDYGFGGGTLACTSDCNYHFDNCIDGCGNNTIDGTDICDGDDLGGATCASSGYTGGDLYCNSDCGSVDTSGCYNDYSIDNTFTFDWIDLSTDASALITNPGDFTSHGPFAIGFDFKFFATSFSEFYISSDGYISFGSGSYSTTNACPITSSSSVDNLIALLWDDLCGDDGSSYGNCSGSVYHRHFASCPVGSSGGQCQIVQYNNYHHYNSTTPTLAGTFQAVLFENGSILIQILDAGDKTGSESTTGILDDDGNGYTWDTCNTADSISDNLAICFAVIGSTGC